MGQGVEVDMVTRYHEDEQRMRIRDGRDSFDEVTDQNGNAVFNPPGVVDFLSFLSHSAQD
jgi:hypothetical protein